MGHARKTMAMAIRNLARNRTRTASTLLAVVVGLLGLTLLDGFISYSMNGFRDSIIGSGTGHIQVARSAAAFDGGDENPLPFLFADTEKAEAMLRGLPGVRDVMPKLSFAASATSGGKTAYVQVSAYPIAQARADLSVRSIIGGKDLGVGQSGLIILGSGLAKRLDAGVGATVSLFALSEGGGVNTQGFTVAGISSSGIKEVDDRELSMSLEDAQSLVGTKNAARLVLFLTSVSAVAGVMNRIEALPRGPGDEALVAKDWKELSPSFRQADSLYLLILAVSRAVVLIVALVSISGTLSLTVMERYREIGTLRAFGTKRPRLIGMIACEGFFLGLSGTLIGSFVGAAVSGAINATGGLTIPAEPGMSIASVNILFTPSVPNLLVNGLALLVASVLAALYPGLRSFRLTIAELLRAI